MRVIFIKNLLRFAFGFVFVVLCGCAHSEQVCVERSEDSAWAVIGGRDLVADLDRYLRSDRARKSAEEILGSPERVTSIADVDHFTWIRGRRRSGKTYSCGRLVGETFQVTYGLIDVAFNGDSVKSCDVRLMSFIGPDREPNPESDQPLLVEQVSCESFIVESKK